MTVGEVAGAGGTWHRLAACRLASLLAAAPDPASLRRASDQPASKLSYRT